MVSFSNRVMLSGISFSFWLFGERIKTSVGFFSASSRELYIFPFCAWVNNPTENRTMRRGIFFHSINFGYFCSERTGNKKALLWIGRLQKNKWEKLKGQGSNLHGAVSQKANPVVNPGRSRFSSGSALLFVCPVIPTPETRGYVCHAFAISSPHNITKNLMTQI